MEYVHRAAQKNLQDYNGDYKKQNKKKSIRSAFVRKLTMFWV